MDKREHWLESHEAALIAIGGGIASLAAPAFADGVTQLDQVLVGLIGAGGVHVLQRVAGAVWAGLNA